MATDDVMVGMVRDELRRISDTGDLASRALLRERVGIGAGDLERCLTMLRDAGDASEVEPDGYRFTERGEADVPYVPEPGVSLAEAERAAAPAPRERVAAIGSGSSRVEFGHDATVTMPRAMVDAMDPQVLGGILKAGIESAEGDTFVFEVVL